MPMTPADSGPAKARAYRVAPSRSRLITGMIVVTASDSKAARKTRALLPMVTHRYRPPKMPSAIGRVLTKVRRETGTHGAQARVLNHPMTRTDEGGGEHG